MEMERNMDRTVNVTMDENDMIDVNLKIKKKPTYKINSKYIFLTYSRVEDSIDLKMILKGLEKKLSFDFFAIGLHKHSDENEGYSNHFHILLKKDNGSKQFRLKEFSLLDLSLNSSIYSADVKKIRNMKGPESVFNYIKKDSIEFESNFNWLFNKEGLVCSKDQFFIEQIKTLGFKKAIIKMDELDSEFVVKNALKYKHYDSILKESSLQIKEKEAFFYKNALYSSLLPSLDDLEFKKKEGFREGQNVQYLSGKEIYVYPLTVEENTTNNNLTINNINNNLTVNNNVTINLTLNDEGINKEKALEVKKILSDLFYSLPTNNNFTNFEVKEISKKMYEEALKFGKIYDENL